MTERFTKESLVILAGSTIAGLGVLAVVQAGNVLSAEEKQSVDDMRSCLANFRVGDDYICAQDINYPSRQKQNLPGVLKPMGLMLGVTGLGLAAYGSCNKRKQNMYLLEHRQIDQERLHQEDSAHQTVQTAQKLREIIRESYIKEHTGPIKPWPPQEDI